MPVPNYYKVTFRFRIVEADWSESYYIQQPDLTSAWLVATDKAIIDPAAGTMGDSLVKQRAALLPGIGIPAGGGAPGQVEGTTSASSPVLTTVKVSDMQRPNVTRKRTVDMRGSLFIPTGGNPADMPWTGVMLRLRSTGNHRRMMCFRPVADAITVQPWDNKVPDSNLFIVEVMKYFEVLKANGCVLRIQAGRKTGVTAITALTVDPLSGLVACSTAPNPHNLSNGAVIWLYRMHCVPILRGRFTVMAPTATTFTLDRTNLGSLVQNGPCGFYPNSYDIDSLAAVTNLRKMARPVFGGKEGPRGRKSNRKGPRVTH
jgi:hypothetical protein